MAKPLKDLMAEADKFLGQTKTASAPLSDEVSSLADTLSFASQIEQQFAGSSVTVLANSEFEKVAKAINKVAARIELDVMFQSSQFEKAAMGQGYSREQVNEALSKIAAQKVHKHLSTLATIGGLAPGKEDLNSLKPVHEKAIGEEKRRMPATHSLGGAR